MLETRAFEPEFLRKLDRLVLGIRRARTIRAGRRPLGRVLGLGIEPENFKEYALGDDLRFLDWNALARLDELMIRTFRAERQVEVTVLIDASASMGTPGRDDKFGLALALGAALGYVAMGDNQPVRLAAFCATRSAMRLRTTLFRSRHECYPEFRDFVVGLKCEGPTRLAAAVGEFMLERRPPGMVIFISDFLVNASDYKEALSALLAARHEVKVIHVLGDQERSGAFATGYYRARDVETGEIREITFDAQGRAAYRRRLEAQCQGLRRFCEEHAIVYAAAFGARNLDQIMTGEFPRLGVVV